MADYHSPTVIDAELPIADMTALERLILCLVFDADEIGADRLYLHAEIGPSSFVSASMRELKAALAASVATDSAANAAVTALLAKHDDADDVDEEDIVDIDLSEAELDADRILKDIVRRSASLDEIVMWSAFTCTRMRPDGFGGSVTRITPEAIQYRSTTAMLEAMWNEAPASAGADGRPTLGRMENLAASAGWDSFTLILQIAAWAERQGHSMALTEHLGRLAAGETG